MDTTRANRPADTAADHEEPSPEIDGRSLRRIRNREKVIDSYLELVAAGNRSPSIDDLAKYSGISFRSIYRYFDAPADLVGAAAERALEMFGGDLAVPDEGVGPLDERIERLVDQRLALYRRSMPYVTAARTAHGDDATIINLFAQLRRTLIDQLGQHFAVEFEQLDDEARRARQIGIYFGFLHDSLRMLHDLYPEDDATIRAILIDHVTRHLR